MLGENFAAICALVNLGVTVFGGFAFLMTVKSHQAVQDVLLENLSKSVGRLDATVEALRRGDGWIQAPMHRSVDREYPSG
ncbi:hypothetical protein QWJ07_31205 [Frankia sp. RB7]|nr:hypothetical protein [Frankia sp. RB7]